MNLSGPFIKRPVATMLLSLAIMLLGGVSFGLLPVSPLPQMDFPVIVVSASLPGASPEVMASTVATPLERAFGAIAGVNTMSSNSSQGSTRVILQFDQDRDINGAAREVQAAINASRNLLPSGMKSMPTYKKINPFYMLPLLGVLGLKARDLIGFSFVHLRDKGRSLEKPEHHDQRSGPVAAAVSSASTGFDLRLHA